MSPRSVQSKRSLQEQVIEILERNTRMPDEQIAILLGVDVETIRSTIKKMEEDKIILGYRTIINRDQVGDTKTTCMIEVRVTPQRGVGFDKIAERIFRFPEVRSLYLMSGSYDLLVVVEGSSIQEISYFVFEKLATLDHIQSTTTHFMLKKYKDDGIILGSGEQVDRLPVAP